MYSHNIIPFPINRVSSVIRPYVVNKQQSSNLLPPLQSRKILEQVRERVRYLHYSMRTEEAYLYWIRLFIRWSGMRHPREMGGDEVCDFLTFLAIKRNVSASTHRVALSSLLFLYHKVLCIDLPWLDGLARPSAPRRLPVVLTREEVGRILALITGDHAVLARLLYGTGMRITEAIQLRVKDVDFDHRAIVIREGKGFKDRVVMLPEALTGPLKQQIADARAIWSQDVTEGKAGIFLPHALEKNIRRPVRAGAGSGYFRKGSIRGIRAQA